jgi:hypothetical protein
MKLSFLNAAFSSALVATATCSWSAVPGASSPVAAEQAKSGADADRSSRPFDLFDAENAFIGRMWTTNLAQLTVNGKRYATAVIPAMQVDGNISPVLLDYALIEWFYYYAEGDCSGQPYAPAGGADLPYGQVEKEGPDRLLFYPLSGENRSIKVHSFYGSAHGCVVFDPPETIALLRVGDPVDITRLYARPFHVR